MVKSCLYPDSAGRATAWYALLTCVATWPLVAHLGGSVPQDLGDPLLNIWILGWDVSRLTRFLGGHWHALSGFWNANVFYPEPLTLAKSEHLLAEAIEILPVYVLTRNLILCYNLLFLSTFVLSGLGAFLLVRELTANPRAAFVAGLLYAFALFRAQHLSHVQVLSSQWMPFVLFGLRRYFTTRRWRPLAGAAAALVAQNLSCGYYLVFFAPFVAAYVLYEIWMHRSLRDRRVWLSLAVAGVAVAALTVPFFLPYVALHARGLGLRAPGEVDQFSADVYSYFTACPNLRLWGRVVQAFPKREGFLFAGIVPVAVAMVGAASAGRRAWRGSRAATGSVERRDPAIPILGTLIVLSTLIGIAVAFAGPRVFQLDVVDRDPSSYFALAVLAAAVLIAVSPRVRALLGPRDDHSTAFFYAAAAAAAVWLSFGRLVRSAGYRLSDPTIYDWLYRHVPGFDGLRVPSRYAMIVTLFLAVLAGFGADAIGRRRFGRPALFILSVAFLVESTFAPLPVYPGGAASKSLLEATMGPGVEQVYGYVNALPQSAVLLEFPIGDDTSDYLYLYASTTHWRRLVNGVTGSTPAYDGMAAALRRPQQDAEASWRTLLGTGATQVVVHEALYPAGEGSRVIEWLRGFGAREVFAVGSHHVFELPRPASRAIEASRGGLALARRYQE